MKPLIVALLVFTTYYSYAQNNNQLFRFSVISETNCDTVSHFFNDDLANKSLYLFIVSGPAPIIYDTDDKFRRKFKVHYYDFGCIVPTSRSCLKAYNFLVFDHLLNKYGDSWMKQIRKDVIGFKDWKKDRLKGSR